MRIKHADPIGLYQFTLGNIGYDPARYAAEPHHAPWFRVPTAPSHPRSATAVSTQSRPVQRHVRGGLCLHEGMSVYVCVCVCVCVCVFV